MEGVFVQSWGLEAIADQVLPQSFYPWLPVPRSMLYLFKPHFLREVSGDYPKPSISNSLFNFWYSLYNLCGFDYFLEIVEAAKIVKPPEPDSSMPLIQAWPSDHSSFKCSASESHLVPCLSPTPSP